MKRLSFDSNSYLYVPGEGSKELEYCEDCGFVRVRVFFRSMACPVCGSGTSTLECGATNPRTGWVCNVRPHPGDDKHWTIFGNGDRHDWFME